MECFLIKYLQIGKAAINRRDECLRKMKELFTSIRRTMRCVIVFQITTHQRHNYSRLETRKVGVGMLQWSVLLVGRSWRDWRRWRVEWRGLLAHTGTLGHVARCAPLPSPQSSVWSCTQTQYHLVIMIEMGCSGGRPDETSILRMFPFRTTNNQWLYVRPTTLIDIQFCFATIEHLNKTKAIELLTL